MRTYPALKKLSTSRLTTDVFVGLDKRLRANAGAFANTENLTGDHYPLAATRQRRGLVRTLTKWQGICALEKLYYVDSGTLYCDGQATAVTGLEDGEKQLVTFGAYVIVFPDGAYLNTVDATDTGRINRLYGSTGSVTYALCTVDGVTYSDNLTVSAEKPANPKDGDYWLNTSGDRHGLYRYTAASNKWVSELSVYVRIGATGIGAGLKEGDGVTLSGITGPTSDAALKEQLEFLNNTTIIQAAGDDYIVVIGVIDRAYTQTTGTVRADRKMPAVDYVVECNNRLWGCRAGTEDGQTLNEIYASALGDFKNWRAYDSGVTGSYAVSVGTEGPFTGAIAYKGMPCFFKDEAVHKVYGDNPGNYQMQTTRCEGVLSGCAKTLVNVAGALMYVGRSGVQLFESTPQKADDQLEGMRFSAGAAGAVNGKYYLSVRDMDRTWHLLTYDTENGMWYREDGLKVRQFARLGAELYGQGADGKLWALMGTAGDMEGAVAWTAESADIGYDYPQHKYLSRYNIRMRMDAAATCRMYVQYDGGVWEDKGTIEGTGRTRTALLNVQPRRCDHMRVKLTGTGNAEIYSIDRILAMGADG